MIMGALWIARGLGASLGFGGCCGRSLIIPEFLQFLNLSLIKFIHGIGQTCGKDGTGPLLPRRTRHFFELFPVFGVWGLKDEGFDRLAVFGAADPHLETWKIGTADVGDYGLDTLVPSRAASLGNSYPGKWKIQVVMYNKHSGRRDTEVLDDFSHRFTASVHKGERLCKQDLTSLGNRKTPGGPELAYPSSLANSARSACQVPGIPRCGACVHILPEDCRGR